MDCEPWICPKNQNGCARVCEEFAAAALKGHRKCLLNYLSPCMCTITPFATNSYGMLLLSLTLQTAVSTMLAGQQSISDQIKEMVNKAVRRERKGKFEFDAIVTQDGDSAILIKFKD